MAPDAWVVSLPRIGAGGPRFPCCPPEWSGRRSWPAPRSAAGCSEVLGSWLLVLDLAALGAAALRGVLDRGRRVDAFRTGGGEGCRLVGGVLFLHDEDLPAAVYLLRPAFTGGKDDGRDGLSELVLVGTAALGAAA